MRVFIGIDPGVAGGVAILGEAGDVLSATKMPETDRDVLEAVRSGKDYGLPVATVEFVRSSPQMGVRSAWTFGVGYGRLRMALMASEIPFEEVTPRKWQAAMRCLTGGDKNVSKARAQELFPGTKVTHNIADALLIAEYGRRHALGIYSQEW